MATKNDIYYMNKCFELAERGAGFVSPNPLVGCVLVKNGEVISEGWHMKFGGPHAEANAISNSRSEVSGSDLYCNLEPCSHTDKKTPPCVPLIVKNGIKRVIISNIDPNPQVAGRGIQELKSRGIEVVEGIEAEKGRRLNRFYFNFMSKNRPYVTLKIARSIDNKISKSNEERTLITGPESQTYLHRLRSVYDAVLVGANTIKVDDPILNARNIKGRNPKRIIIDGVLSSPVESRVFNDGNSHDTFLFSSTTSDAGKKELLRRKGVKIIELPSEINGRLELSKILTILKEYKIISILVEGGSEIFSQFTERDLFDELIIIQAPIILGRGLEAARTSSTIKLELLDSVLLGNDIRTVYVKNY